MQPWTHSYAVAGKGTRPLDSVALYERAHAPEERDPKDLYRSSLSPHGEPDDRRGERPRIIPRGREAARGREAPASFFLRTDLKH